MTKRAHGLPLFNAMEDHGLTWLTMVFHGRRCWTMVNRGFAGIIKLLSQFQGHAHI